METTIIRNNTLREPSFVQKIQLKPVEIVRLPYYAELHGLLKYIEKMVQTPLTPLTADTIDTDPILIATIKSLKESLLLHYENETKSISYKALTDVFSLSGYTLSFGDALSQLLVALINDYNYKKSLLLVYQYYTYQALTSYSLIKSTKHSLGNSIVSFRRMPSSADRVKA